MKKDFIRTTRLILPFFIILLSAVLLKGQSLTNKVYINFNKYSPAPAPWNNFDADPLANTTLIGLIDDEEVTTGISIALVDDWTATQASGVETGDNSGVYPDDVMKSYYRVYNSTAQLKISGLNVNKTYNFRFLSSRDSDQNTYTDISIGAETITTDAAYNATNLGEITGVVPDVNGEVLVTVSNGAGSTQGYLNGMEIEYARQPNPPSDLSAIAASTSEIGLSWTDNSDNERRFEIYRSLVSGGDYTLIGSVGQDVTAYTDAGLDGSSTYYYVVRAINTSDASVYSDEVSATTHTPLTNAKRVFVNFNKYSPVAAPWNNFNADPVANTTLSNLTDHEGGATPFSITLVNDWAGTQTSGATTGDNSGVYPDDVTKSYYKVHYGAADLKISGLNPEKRYTFRFLSSRDAENNVLTDITIGDATITTDAAFNTTGLGEIAQVVPDVNGEVLVTVSNAYGSSQGYLNGMEIEYSSDEVSAPQGFRVEAWDAGSITLRWNDLENEAGYVIERSATSGSGFAEVATVEQNQVEWKDDGLSTEQVYYYRIKAIGPNSNESDYSAEVNGSTSTQVDTNTDLFQKRRYGGSITAVRWKRFGDKNQKVYTYHYDKARRLTEAQYAEGTTTGGIWTTVARKGAFSVNNLSYDHNGNIQTVNRQSAEETIAAMDAMTYSYIGNRLMAVDDEAGSEGMKDRNTTGDDYAYDDNGNVTKDLNQGITLITYNHMDLPERIEKISGEYMTYVYDASGSKLLEEHYDADGELVKRIDYIGGFVFENDELKLIHHEEGRVVPDELNGGFEYQYDIRDHLGNSRVTFSDKPKEVTFTLNFENNPDLPDDTGLFEGAKPHFNDQMDHTDKKMGNPADPGEGEANEYFYSQKLDGSEGNRVGAVLAIPVAAGDQLTAEAYAKFIDIDAGDVGTVTGLAASLINAYTGATGIGNEMVNQTINGSYTGDNGSIIGTAGFPVEDAQAPMAFLNVLFLPENEVIDIGEEHFAYDQIDRNAVQPVGDVTNHPFDHLLVEDFEAPSQGYMLIYISNESNTLVDVHFDDIAVTVTQKEVVQADDYYPFGLTFNTFRRLGGSKNDYLYQGKQQMENTDWYDFHARGYSPVLGRFMQVDPKYNGPSGYVGMMNDPLGNVDPDGEEPVTLSVGAVIAISAAISAVSYTASVAMSEGGFRNWDWGQFGLNTTIGAISGAVTFGIGSAFTSAAATATASQQTLLQVGKIATHAAFQGGMSAVQGGDFWMGAASGAAGSVVGLGTENWTSTGGKIATVGVSMLMGGTTAELSGGEFWKGAAIAGIVAGANHVAHRTAQNVMQKRRDAQNGGSSARYFSNKEDAYDYMWKNSFDKNGKPIREVSGWELKRGVIVLPYDKNHLTPEGGAVSYNDDLPIKKIKGKIAVQYKDKWYYVDTHVHTHPLSHSGFNWQDHEMVKYVNKGIHILWNEKLFWYKSPSNWINYGSWKK